MGRLGVWVSVVALILGTVFGALGAVFWTANTALMNASELKGRMDVIEQETFRSKAP